MIQLNIELLDSLGLGPLRLETKQSLLDHLYDKLELNVGTTIASELTEEQLKQFEVLIDENKQQEALAWLQDNYPDYKKVVEQELNKLKDEISVNAESILASDKQAS